MRAELRVRIEKAIGRVWRRGVLTFGTDVSAASQGRSCLVIAPHPDDETLGCGATIRSKALAGTRVTVVVATDGRHSTSSAVMSPERLAEIRADELRAAMRELGVHEDGLRMLGFEDGSLATSHDALTARLREIIDETDPDEILVTSARDGHPDHIAIHRATVDAAGPNRLARVATFPVWWWYLGYDRRQVAGQPVRRRARRALLVLSGALTVRAKLIAIGPHRDAKERAIAAYRSQLSALTGEAQWSTFPEDFVAAFLGEFEVFFPTRRRRSASASPSP